MKSHIQKLNQTLIAGWLLIVGVLFVSYSGEVLKGERTLLYLITFMAVTALPAFFCLYLYRRDPDMFHLRYCIVVGYFLMYLFSMMTGSTSMVFCYILPMLSFLILYHQPKLIVATGIASFIVNIIFIALKIYNGTMNLSNSKEAEIQLALLVLCFAGSYFATKLYDEITDENIAYMEILDKKNSEIQKMALQTITTIANTIDAKDEYTKGHSSRVAEYSAAIAEELGLSDKEVQNIRSIALLHDIGKISIPDSVLNKPGKLTDEEYQLMKLHTTAGSKILKDIEMIPGIDIGAKYHHERYDGKGYPDGLAGEEIPFLARIIATADAYDAMTSNRVYRKHLEADKVLQELEDGVGTQFDPKAAKALIRLIKEGQLENISPDSAENQDEAATILSRIMKSNEEKVAGKILFDELTSTYNRNNGEKIMQEILEEHPGCLMMFDIDHFRHINNTTGFIRGDIFLLETVKCIRELGNNSIISRFGGDEFVVLFQNIQTKEQAIEVAKQFFQIMAEKRRENKELSDLSVSVGIVYPSKIKESFSSLLLKVNKALYFAKQQGGNTYYIHNETLSIKKNNTANVDLQHLINRINNTEPDDKFILSYLEPEHIYKLIQDIAAKNQHQIRLLMFTVITEEREHVSVEERDQVMRFLERAIIDSIRNFDITMKYSSTQQIVILSNVSEEECHTLTEHIMTEFYKMYDRKEITVHLDMADLNQKI